MQKVKCLKVSRMVCNRPKSVWLSKYMDGYDSDAHANQTVTGEEITSKAQTLAGFQMPKLGPIWRITWRALWRLEQRWDVQRAPP
jgi:hypothetical protein